MRRAAQFRMLRRTAVGAVLGGRGGRGVFVGEGFLLEIKKVVVDGRGQSAVGRGSGNGGPADNGAIAEWNRIPAGRSNDCDIRLENSSGPGGGVYRCGPQRGHRFLGWTEQPTSSTPIDARDWMARRSTRTCSPARTHVGIFAVPTRATALRSDRVTRYRAAIGRQVLNPDRTIRAYFACLAVDALRLPALSCFVWQCFVPSCSEARPRCLPNTRELDCFQNVVPTARGGGPGAPGV